MLNPKNSINTCKTNPFEIFNFYPSSIHVFLTETIPQAFQRGYDSTAYWIDKFVKPFFESCQNYFAISSKSLIETCLNYLGSGEDESEKLIDISNMNDDLTPKPLAEADVLREQRVCIEVPNLSEYSVDEIRSFLEKITRTISDIKNTKEEKILTIEKEIEILNIKLNENIENKEMSDSKHQNYTKEIDEKICALSESIRKMSIEYESYLKPINKIDQKKSFEKELNPSKDLNLSESIRTNQIALEESQAKLIEIKVINNKDKIKINDKIKNLESEISSKKQIVNNLKIDLNTLTQLLI